MKQSCADEDDRDSPIKSRPKQVIDEDVVIIRDSPEPYGSVSVTPRHSPRLLAATKSSGSPHQRHSPRLLAEAFFKIDETTSENTSSL